MSPWKAKGAATSGMVPVCCWVAPLLLALLSLPASCAGFDLRKESRGTWVQLSPLPAATNLTADGRPEVGCDPTVIHRGNGVVLFGYSGGFDPVTPFVNQFWWQLDTKRTPLQWELFETDPTSPLPQARGAFPYAYDPLHDVMYAFGGWTVTPGSQDYYYIDDFWKYDFAARKWTELQPPSERFNGNNGVLPTARAWNQGLKFTDETYTKLFLYGGAVTYDGDPYSVNAISGADYWYYDIAAAAWTGHNLRPCRGQTTVCVNSTTAAELSHVASDIVKNLTDAMALSVRPSEMLSNLDALRADVSRLYAELTTSYTGWNASEPHEDANDTASCTTFCNEFDEYPGVNGFEVPRSYGTDFPIFEGNMYMIGGYSCLEMGQTISTDYTCILSDMYIMDIEHGNWTVIPRAGAADAAYWPTPRWYSTNTIHNRKLWVYGGLFIDLFNDRHYLSDIYSFDIDSRTWLPTAVQGRVPQTRNEHMTVSLGTAGPGLVMFAGCVASVAFNDLFLFRVDSVIEAANCTAIGAGVRTITPNVVNHFLITPGLMGRDAMGNVTLVQSYDWGVGLVFDVTLTGKSTAGVPIILKPSVEELPGGVYNVTYSIDAGYGFNIFILLNKVNIAGSPFEVQLRPLEPIPAASYGQGIGLSIGSLGGTATFDVYPADMYGNVAIEPGLADRIVVFLSSDNNTAAANVSATAQALTAAANILIVDNGDGSYTVTYNVPPVEKYFVHVMFDGQRIRGSPYTASTTGVRPLTPVIYSQSVEVEGGLYAACALMLLVTLGFTAFLIHMRREAPIRASSPVLCLVILVGIAMIYGAVLLWTPYAPTLILCTASSWMGHIGFALAYGALFFKTYRLNLILNMSDKMIRRTILTDGSLVARLSLVLLLLVAYLAAWTAVDAPRPFAGTLDNLSAGTTSQFKWCSSSSTVWSAVLLIAEGLVLGYGAVLCYQARNHPSLFNESSLIAICIYNTAILGALFIILSKVVLNDPFQLKVAESIGMILCATVTLVVVFGAKVKSIYCPSKDDVDDKRQLATNNHNRTKLETPDEIKDVPNVSGDSGRDGVVCMRPAAPIDARGPSLIANGGTAGSTTGGYVTGQTVLAPNPSKAVSSAAVPGRTKSAQAFGANGTVTGGTAAVAATYGPRPGFPSRGSASGPNTHGRSGSDHAPADTLPTNVFSNARANHSGSSPVQSSHGVGPQRPVTHKSAPRPRMTERNPSSRAVSTPGLASPPAVVGLTVALPLVHDGRAVAYTAPPLPDPAASGGVPGANGAPMPGAVELAPFSSGAQVPAPAAGGGSSPDDGLNAPPQVVSVSPNLNVPLPVVSLSPT